MCVRVQAQERKSHLIGTLRELREEYRALLHQRPEYEKCTNTWIEESFALKMEQECVRRFDAVQSNMKWPLEYSRAALRKVQRFSPTFHVDLRSTILGGGGV